MLLPGWLRLRLSRSRQASDHPRRSTSLVGDLSLLLLAIVASRPSPAGAVVRAWSCRADTCPIPVGQALHLSWMDQGVVHWIGTVRLDVARCRTQNFSPVP